MQLTHQHEAIRDTAIKFINTEINPHVDEWERAEIFPAHEIFKKMGDLGLLGINKPEADGGLGLDYSYAAILNEATGHIDCGGVPMAIGVQTDMATPALARWGSRRLARASSSPRRSPATWSACVGVCEVPSAGSDVAVHQDHAPRK